MFNTLFTSLPVIFLGVFEKDLSASTLLAVPELYTKGQRNGGFNFKVYLGWTFMASAEAMLIYFTMYGVWGMPGWKKDDGVYALGTLGYTACVVIINLKLQYVHPPPLYRRPPARPISPTSQTNKHPTGSSKRTPKP